MKQKFDTHVEKISNISLQDKSKGAYSESIIAGAYTNLIDGDDWNKFKSKNKGLLLNNTFKTLLQGLQEIDYDEVTFGLQDFVSKFETKEYQLVLYFAYKIIGLESIYFKWMY